MYAFLQNLRLAFFTLLIFGFGFPLLVVGIGKAVFPKNAVGNPVELNGKTIGFSNIGQKFDKPGYFWGRPSAVDYNAAATGGSNKGPTNPEYLATVRERVASLYKAHPDQAGKDIPVDLVTASGSGIDPDISPEAARYQAKRVASERHLALPKVMFLIAGCIEHPLLGPAHVNVLALNLSLDILSSPRP